MWAPRVDMAALVTPSSDSFKTDGDISRRSAAVGRDLTRAGAEWVGDSSTLLAGLEEDDDGKGFDQFETIRRMTGHNPTFDEDAYTTRLNRSEFSQRDRAEASRVAKEIMGSSTTNFHVAEERGQGFRGGFDSEARYSGVLRSQEAPPTDATMRQ